MAFRRICAVLLCMSMGLACAAPDSSPQYALSIHAGLPLEEALQELARQTGIQLLFISKITAGRSAPELSGEYTLTAALTRLLEGSGLTFRQVNEHTVEVRQAPPRAARSPLKARQSTSAPASDEPMQVVKVIATAEQLVATRVPTPLQEIPQSLSVVSSEQIRQQNSFELADVMLNTPGFAVRRTTSLDETAYSRAFQVTTFHVDGGGAVKPSFNYWNLYLGGNPDLSEFDRVEVLRGSDALFSGNGNPGGTVSLVRKRALPTTSLGMSATLGSWNNYRIELDATGPLTNSGDLRARADVVYATRDYFFKRAHQDRKKVFATVEYDVTPNSTVTAGGSYQWDDALPLASGVPLYSDGRDSFLPRSTSLSFDWAYYNTRLAEAYLQYRQQFFDDWILKLNTSAQRIIADYGYGEFTGDINKVSHYLGLPIAGFSTRPNQFTVGGMDATFTGKFNWFGLRERVAIGGDFTRTRGNQAIEDYFGFGPELTDVATFDPKAYPDPRTIRAPDLIGDTRVVLEEYGGFVSLQADVTKALTLTGAVRIATDRFKKGSTVSSGGVSIPIPLFGLNDNHVVQPFGALMYRISGHLSWYVSYADIYRGQFDDYLKSDGSPVGPQHGVTAESGIKGAWREGALNGSLAVYRTEQQGMPIYTGAQSNLPICCFRSGTARSRGVELDLDGELSSGWLIGSGYAYNLYATGTSEYPVTSTPRHLLKVWTSERLPGAFSHWTIGGSLRAQTTAPGVQAVKSGVLVPLPGTRPYAVVDLRAGFQLDRHWQVALSVNNVLDKRYYLSEDTPIQTFWYGDPRNFMFRIDAKY